MDSCGMCILGYEKRRENKEMFSDKIVRVVLWTVSPMTLISLVKLG